MRRQQRHWHQRFGLVDRVAEHAALVSRTLIGTIHALGDFRRLFGQIDHHARRVRVQAVFGRVAGVADDVAYDALHVHRGGGADFSEHMNQVAACGRLHGRVGVRVLRQQRVENTV